MKTFRRRYLRVFENSNLSEYTLTTDLKNPQYSKASFSGSRVELETILKMTFSGIEVASTIDEEV